MDLESQRENMDETQPKLTGLNDEQLTQHLVDYFKEIQREGTKVIALVGGPAAGKGKLAERLADVLGKERTAVLSTDNYLKGDRAWRRANVENQPGKSPLDKYDPEFLKKQVEAIKALQDGQELGIPVYDGVSGIAISADPNKIPDDSVYEKKVKGRQDFVIIEGDFQFLALELLDRLIYLDVSNNVRLENRIYRDTKDRGETDVEKIRSNFDSRQVAQFLPYTQKEKSKADLVIKVDPKPLENPTSETKFQYFYDLEFQH